MSKQTDLINIPDAITVDGNTIYVDSNGQDAGYNPLQIGNTSNSNTIVQILSANNGIGTIHFGDAASGSGRYIGFMNYDHTIDQFQIGTNDSSRFKIDASGRVTTPNQPSFMAVGSSTTPSSQSYWPWGSIIYNEGSHFSLATGRFTAPVAGKYMFFATFIGSNSNDVYRYFTRKNNANYPKANSQLRLDTSSANTDYEYGTSAILMDMAAGDYASIYFESGGTASHPSAANTNSGHEIFSGYLIG